MILEVMDMRPQEITESDRPLLPYVDVPYVSWQAKYILQASKLGIIPIAGQNSSRFDPEKPLLRGEAAAYIYGAMNAKQAAATAKQESETAAAKAGGSSSKPAEEPTMKNVQFPFTDADRFAQKKNVSYVFDISSDTVIWTKASISNNSTGQVTCRLYLLGADGFSNEYYLGTQDGTDCVMNVAVRPGKYQLQVQPSVADTLYAVEAKAGKGDGNDGFKEAIKIFNDKTQVGVLTPNETADWFTFTVSRETQAIIEVSAVEKLHCIIYPPADFDQFGFAGPECDKPYLFPDGTYTVSVSRSRGPLAKQQTFSIKWKVDASKQ